ncbi:RbsD/FucU domain-containing protein [Microbacterium sp. F51-2R]|uniref:RbsD/FucU domain-containing protein n=1 Tax=Microbacterium sp. F51-2R TaxID=3445777 RepID=UPI003FA12D84
MLRGIDPLLRGELLHLLDDMGHTDRLLLADANFPLIRVTCPVVRLGESRMSRALDAVLSVFPLDEPLDDAVTRMMIDPGHPEELNASQRDCLTVLRRHTVGDVAFRTPPRETFYEEALQAAAVVHVLEPVPASCLILTKGVVYPAPCGE